jgi:uncharacterized protein (DUF2252 family)
MSHRDPVEEIVRFNRPLLAPERRVPAAEGGGDLTAEALRRKLDALARDPFAFFRGTFHLFANDVLQERSPLAQAHAPQGLIVGDLHLENFGAYRGASGALCFDVNDFDDVGFGPLDLDVKRLCTSALLLPGADHASRASAAKGIAQSWAEGVLRLGGRFPVHAYTADKAEAEVAQILRERGHKTEEELLEKAAPEKGHKRFGPGGEPPRYVHVDAHWRKLVEAAVVGWREQLEQLHAELPHKGEWELFDVAYRFKGTGSLGRLRFSALVGHGEDRRIVEIKEARPSALDEAQARPAAGERARMQTAAIRRLQGDPWPYVAGTHLGPHAALARTVEPEEEKISAEDLAALGKGALAGYARQCGEVLARLHVRESAPLMFGAQWDVERAAEQAVQFADKYAKQVEADYAAFCKHKDDVAARLA